ncbi:alpha-amylase family protein [Halorarum halophilum]|uniref:Alpha-amylase family protein n=1 Tax=Halorarum halophilum TaxID=2743090 RepID=A0A7D5KP97_9EURY|nr:alpha-amylase family protein [Halobaculum halophilum]QLG29262.1 alpha-amylase family protein [Halobaculum halophilum]
MVSVSPETWFKNAVVYAVDVEAFNDSDGDGVGDFQGLTQKLDYLDRLGVSALWLLPFYPTPNRDNGYDVSDYYGVDPRLGTLGDFVEFMDEAEARGIRVIIDLVVNHTSDQHPWFKAAQEDPDSKYRDYYVWVDERPPPDPERATVFPGEVEDERVWTYDEEADAYYYHRFYPFQPDLNLANPDVRAEIYRIMKFWLELGVAGFRVDAATLMIQPKHPDAEQLDDPHEVLRSLKRHAVARRSDAVLLAEADDAPGELESYFGDGAEMDLLMNFVLNAHLVAALATERAAPLAEGLERLPPADVGQWMNFLRNYDELNIGRLPKDLQDEVFERFAPDTDMRIYGRGIRRRLAPMLDGDERRVKLAFSLLFSMPGTPMLLYGDEIGMGEDLSLPGRTSVRTPMQWTDEENAGFSTASEDDLVLPVVSGGRFGHEEVNVAAQRADAESLLNWMERLIATRRESREIGEGSFSVIDVDHPCAFAHRYDFNGNAVVCVHNLSDGKCSLEFDLDLVQGDALYPLLGNADHTRHDDGSCEITLDDYGYIWLRLHRTGAGASRRSASESGQQSRPEGPRAQSESR